MKITSSGITRYAEVYTDEGHEFRVLQDGTVLHWDDFRIEWGSPPHMFLPEEIDYIRQHGHKILNNT